MKQPTYISIQEMLDLVKDQDEIVVGMAANEPQTFMANLHKIANRIEHVSVTNCLPITNADFFIDEQYRHKFTLDGWFYTGVLRKAHQHGNISFIPNHLHLAGYKRLFHKKPNIFISAAAMPDANGYVSLSLSNVYEKQMIEAADIVILEINPNFPRTLGDLEVHLSEVDYLVKVDYPVPTLPDIEPNEKDMVIGKLIAEKINDGDTIQLGIGGMPNAVAKSLYGKKDLGIHTEMFTSEMAKLIKAGVITGKNKTLHRGKHVCCFAYGNQELYDFINDNPSVWILNGHYVNDPNVIGKNKQQVSINSTIEIDLSGQCASESLGTQQFSGTGGQADTAIGAQISEGGRSFIALYSTAMVKNPETGLREETSKIVTTLKTGAAVTLSRNDVDYVVTEYGMVSLRGTNIRERALLLISIAHPKFREQLLKEAIEVGYLHESFLV
ncbi:MAG: acetyl-CoA hydrolase/transferase C-terminal domain-containing protein [Paracholeplasma sp.]|uniref:4-hydroxybutyrate coenzyme A transferase n=1 Tax=Acholeplasma brassicae TaxID=61635 RepID=U4KNM3_9MOLU|nr:MULTISPECIES: acetyl-CoA hydrolase/transferase C-terminal domain-containing protein [Paracholeplasma]MDY3196629.1 acetyl-CoA hydrolase/transferase C-terminal domain-containing protein [Paracholeplasma sp.]CCV65947.1 4-hydroxybutyrate coenzyme A transferase [Paracholeplasma brassicae]